MMVADRGWATQNLITQSDTPCTGGYKFTLPRLALRLRRENSDADSTEALSVRESLGGCIAELCHMGNLISRARIKSD